MRRGKGPPLAAGEPFQCRKCESETGRQIIARSDAPAILQSGDSGRRDGIPCAHENLGRSGRVAEGSALLRR
jgi:hypothetical protein